MPLERISIKTQVWRKIESCAKRDKNSELKALMATNSWCAKTTVSPKNDTIVWEPTDNWKRIVADVLENELTFMRKQESATFKFTQQTIADLRAKLPT